MIMNFQNLVHEIRNDECYNINLNREILSSRSVTLIKKEKKNSIE